MPPGLQADEDQPRVEDADRRDADGNTERPAGSAGKGDAAQDGGGEHVELEADADRRRDAAEPPGDQHRDEADQQAVDRVEADDGPADRNAAEFGRARVAADRVDAQPRHRAGQDERADDEDADGDDHGVLDAEDLAPAQFEQRFRETVDGGAADDEGEAAVEREHRQRHDERRDAELAHQNAVHQTEQETEPEPDADGKQRRPGSRTATFATMMPMSATMLPMRQIDIAGDQKRRGAEHGDQDRRRVDADDDEILEPEERRVEEREEDDQRHRDERQAERGPKPRRAPCAEAAVRSPACLHRRCRSRRGAMSSVDVTACMRLDSNRPAASPG